MVFLKMTLPTLANQLMTYIYSTFIVSFSGDKPKKKLLNICSGALNAKYGLKAGHALNTINSLKAGGRSECQIWVESGARFQHHI